VFDFRCTAGCVDRADGRIYAEADGGAAYIEIDYKRALRRGEPVPDARVLGTAKNIENPKPVDLLMDPAHAGALPLNRTSIYQYVLGRGAPPAQAMIAFNKGPYALPEVVLRERTVTPGKLPTGQYYMQFHEKLLVQNKRTIAAPVPCMPTGADKRTYLPALSGAGVPPSLGRGQWTEMPMFHIGPAYTESLGSILMCAGPVQSNPCASGAASACGAGGASCAAGRDGNGVFVALCRCRTGYEVGSDGKCALIDECTRNTEICRRPPLRRLPVGLDTNEPVCSNKSPRYACDCPTGYEMSPAYGVCVKPADPCAGANRCDANATCVPLKVGYTCACAAGFGMNGKGACVRFGCDTGGNAQCSLSGGDCVDQRKKPALANAEDFECTCPAGFDGVMRRCNSATRTCSPPGRCTDLDECSMGFAPYCASQFAAGKRKFPTAAAVRCVNRPGLAVCTLVDNANKALYDLGSTKALKAGCTKTAAAGAPFGAWTCP